MQAPVQHSWLAVHVRPHAPQCATEPFVSTHEPPQQVVPPVHAGWVPHWQTPATHDSPVAHDGVHVEGGTHEPPTQLSPAAQTIVQDPQCDVLVEVFTHEPLQQVLDPMHAAPEPQRQVPPLHVSPAPHAGEHAVAASRPASLPASRRPVSGVTPPMSGVIPPMSGVIPPMSGVIPPMSGVIPPMSGVPPPSRPASMPRPASSPGSRPLPFAQPTPISAVAASSTNETRASILAPVRRRFDEAQIVTLHSPPDQATLRTPVMAPPSERPSEGKLRCAPLAPPFHVVLHEPEIPPNTGSVARTCAATSSPLHLIKPLGFRIDEHAVRRAGLDYWHLVDLRVHDDWAAYRASEAGRRVHLFSANTAASYLEADLEPGDALVFGRESVGLPAWLLEQHTAHTWGIPTSGPVRSLNLSNAVAIVLYEALRRSGTLARR